MSKWASGALLGLSPSNVDFSITFVYPAGGLSTPDPSRAYLAHINFSIALLVEGYRQHWYNIEDVLQRVQESYETVDCGGEVRVVLTAEYHL